MSLTAWKTWASGDVLTAADMNTYLRDNGRWLSRNATGGAPLVRVYNSADLTVVSGSEFTVTFDTDLVDLGALHNTGSNTERITAGTGQAGWYLVGASLIWDSNATGLRRLRIMDSTLSWAEEEIAPNSGAVTIQTISTLIHLPTAGTSYAQVKADQNSGADRVLNHSGTWAPGFWAAWIGE